MVLASGRIRQEKPDFINLFLKNEGWIIYTPDGCEETRSVNILKYKKAEYPKLARKMEIEGTTVVRLTVNTSGKPEKLKVYETSGSDILDWAALKAARQCKFLPAINNGRLIKQDVMLIYEFKLEEEDNEFTDNDR